MSIRATEGASPKPKTSGYAATGSRSWRAAPVVHLRERGSPAHAGGRSVEAIQWLAPAHGRRLQPPQDRPKPKTSGYAATGSRSWRATPVVHLRERGSPARAGGRSVEAIQWIAPAHGRRLQPPQDRPKPKTSAYAATGSRSWRAVPVVHLRERGSPARRKPRLGKL